MPFTYNADDPTADLDRVRLYIGDTLEDAGPRVAGRNYTDAEIAMFIAQAGSWSGAVPRALRAMANEYAAASRSMRFEAYSEDFTQTAVRLREQAAEWERSYSNDTGARLGGIVGGQVVIDVFETNEE